jgi:competence protein ComEA
MESSTSKTSKVTNRFGIWIESLVTRMRASAWTPLAAKVAAGLGGFLALAFVGSGAAADLLPGRVGTYLGPPTNSSAAPSASASPAPVASASIAPGQTAAAPDAGAPETDAAAPSPTTSAITADGKVILNLATEDDLRKLPGIGPKKAQAIIALRTKLKKFSRPEDLLRVKGIGRKKLAKLRPRLLIDPPDKP